MSRRPLVLIALLLAVACNKGALEEHAKPAASASEDLPGGLTPELAAKVLARVGDRTITLGDYAAALDRMNEFDRVRYQSPERRRELLNEMIDLELLAAEAQKRGLDQDPQVKQAIRQGLRDALLADARKTLPGPNEIPLQDVRAYFDAHKDEYKEPERRRVSAIVLKDPKEAEKILPDAKKATAMEWGKLVQKYADPPVKPGPTQPLESLGDLGIVGPMDDPKGDSPKVPNEVRAAIYTAPPDIGAVVDKPITVGDRTYIAKIAGRTPPHERTFAEAERQIRGILLQQRIDEQERDLEKILEKDTPVEIDQAALAKVQVPAASVAPPPPPPSASH